MLIGPFLKFPRYKAPCQYIRSYLMNRNFMCKICGIYFLHNIYKNVSGCPLMYLTMPFLDKILLWNVNFVAFWRSQSSHLPRLRVPLDTGRPFLGCPVRGFYCSSVVEHPTHDSECTRLPVRIPVTSFFPLKFWQKCLEIFMGFLSYSYVMWLGFSMNKKIRISSFENQLNQFA